MGFIHFIAIPLVVGATVYIGTNNFALSCAAFLVSVQLSGLRL